MAVAAIGIAAATWRDTANTIPLHFDLVPGIRADPRLDLAEIETRVGRDGRPANAEDAARMTLAAKEALRRNPLTPGALRDLALASRSGSDPGFRKALELAEQISRRDAGTQRSLLSLAAADGDYDAAMVHVDRLLTVMPEALPGLVEAMAAVAEEPAGQRALKRYAGRRWFADFAIGAASTATDPHGLVALLIGTSGLPTDERRRIVPPIMYRLAAVRDFAAARQFAIKFVGANPAALDDFRPSPATAREDLRPLSWSLIPNAKVEISLDSGDKFQVSIQPGTVATLIHRVTQLPPGTYVLAQSVNVGSGADALRLEWRMNCATDPGQHIIWRQEISATMRQGIPVDIPERCSAQHWYLTAITDEGQMPANFIFSVTLAPS